MLIPSDCSPSGWTIRPANDPEAKRFLARQKRNRRNARKSTGPRTEEGKNRSKMNALRHGLCAESEVVLPHEDKAAYARLRDDILDGLNPTDAVEIAIAQRMINAKWKLQRIRDAEAQLHADQAPHFVEEREEEVQSAIRCSDRPKDERKKLLAESEHRQETDWVNIKVGQLFTWNFDGWDNLSRHEHRLANAFFRALRELRQWRKDRRIEQKEREEDETEQSADDRAVNEATNSQNEPTATFSVATNETSEVCERHGAQTVIPITTSDVLKVVQTPAVAQAGEVASDSGSEKMQN